ncbi:Ni/Fe hydrogenase subunit alpha [Candidatus Bathyarchaeota archaeon]|nr:Ni/Fe hydrogenase subunit alpha [Candidatus Bathyarchaeota archaeon]
MNEQIVINPLTRLEGTGNVKIEVESGKLKDLQLTIAVAPRFFEYLLLNKPAEDAPRISERICGICYVNHHLVSVKTIEDAWGVTIPEVATLLRRTLNAASFITSHTLHLAFLALPDLIPIKNRNIVGVAETLPDIADAALRLHEYGNKVVSEIGGRIVQVVTAVPGGMTKGLTGEIRYKLLREGRMALNNVKKFADTIFNIYENRINDPYEYMGLKVPYLGLVNSKGEYEIYDGDLRIKGNNGNILLQIPPQEYYKYFEETSSGHSFTKITYLKEMGKKTGLNRVGPLARINVVDGFKWQVSTEYLKSYSKLFKRPSDDTAAYNLARTIELVASVEEVLEGLANDIITLERTRIPVKSKEGWGSAFTEAPRGLLHHTYETDANGIIKNVNIVAPTTFNHKSIENNIRIYAEHNIDGLISTDKRSDVLWGIEKIVRAYDPCLSCSVHMVEIDLTIDGEKTIDRGSK